MRHGSLFAGIGGFDEGFRRAGMTVVWQVEKEPFCKKVLKARFPEAEILSDVKNCGKRNLKPVDVLTAGFPCQDLSVAGKRAGLEGARSGLFWEVVRILGELRPAWFVLENVPGLFSSCEGRDFAVVLNALDELGYGVAWRVLNSQFFGVAQRRRRVFIVGCFGKPCPQEVLFEPESGGWDSAESEEARTIASGEVAASVGGAGHEGGWMPNAEQSAGGHLVASPITASYGKQIDSSDRNGGPPNIVQQGICGTLKFSNSGGCRIDAENAADGFLQTVPNVTGTLDGKQRGANHEEAAGGQLIAGFRMQAFGEYADDDTASAKQRDWKDATDLICSPAYADRVRDFAGLPAGMDSARYRALGNAVTVSVAEWIGKRIMSAHTD